MLQKHNRSTLICLFLTLVTCCLLIYPTPTFGNGSYQHSKPSIKNSTISKTGTNKVNNSIYQQTHHTNSLKANNATHQKSLQGIGFIKPNNTKYGKQNQNTSTSKIIITNHHNFGHNKPILNSTGKSANSSVAKNISTTTSHLMHGQAMHNVSKPHTTLQNGSITKNNTTKFNIIKLNSTKLNATKSSNSFQNYSLKIKPQHNNNTGHGQALFPAKYVKYNCVQTNCTSFMPICPNGYLKVDQYKTGCSKSSESRNYCCLPGKGPSCFTTTCTSFKTTCPSGYLQLDRDTNSCANKKQKSLCCLKHQRPKIFNTSCTKFTPTCPSGYKQVKRLIGKQANCTKSSMQRNTCFRTSASNTISGNGYDVKILVIISSIVLFANKH